MTTTPDSKQPQASTSRPSRAHRVFPLDAGPRSPREIAARISKSIDEEIKKDSSRRRASRKGEVKVMVLGQAESGKSTLLKQFQLFYASRSLDVERLSWVPVIYSNIIRAVRMIFLELEYETSLEVPEEPLSRPEVCRELSSFRMRVLPLLALESVLASELSGGVTLAGGRAGAYVRQGWQALSAPTWSNLKPEKVDRPNRVLETTKMVARTLADVVDDIDALWAHEAVKFYLFHRKIRLDDSASYFLRHIQRIAEPEYSPTNDDILHARLRTLGVMQHSFRIATAKRIHDWKIYDVGGARGRRHAWAPYFDDAAAIIFLAPISAFDQYLEEDPSINRINDSLQLFSDLCSNRLLRNAKLVLLLNKTDILREKLEAGVEIQKYITSFGMRPNNFETVSDYFRSHFLQVHRRKDVSNRPLYVHFTSLLDIKATQSILPNVGEAIIQKHVAQAGLA